MMGTGARVVVISNPSGSWRVDAEAFPGIVTAAGADSLAAFCRLFLWTDRLTSAGSLLGASREKHGTDSVAFRRNMHSLLWYVVGCLRELGCAIETCRSVLTRRGLIDANIRCWTRLRELEKRWDNDPMFIKMRNKAAFHFDMKLATQGLNKIASASGAQITCSTETPIRWIPRCCR